MNRGLFLTLTSFLVGSSIYAQERTLINGREANPADFPASVLASMSGSACTGTVVGERVLFIAAHCVEGSLKATFSVGPNKYSTKCEITSRYARGVDHDLALCLTDKPVTGIPFESLNLDPSILNIGDELLLTGYGCTKAGGSGGNDGTYRIGESKITSLPKGSTFDMTTSGGGALCYGDSGGPAFKYLDQSKTSRIVVSANSKGDIATTSYLTSTSTPESIEFITQWASKNQVKICGVDKTATGCRAGAAPAPDAPQECILASQAKALETWQQCLNGSGAPNIVTCDQANDQLQNCYAKKQQ